MKLLKNLTVQTALAGVAGYLLSRWLFQGESPSVGAEQLLGLLLIAKGAFLTGLKMLIAPMIFFSLLQGLLQLGDASKLSSLGRRTLIYYLGTTGVAILIGLFVVLFIHPWEGSGVRLSPGEGLDSFGAAAPSRLINAAEGSTSAIFTGLLQRALDNPFHALAEGNLIGIVTSAILFGLALLFAGARARPLVELIGILSEATFRILGWLLRLLPLGVFAIVFDFQRKVSGDLVTELFAFALVVLAATLLHGLVILPLIARIVAGVSPRVLFKGLAQPLLLALTTSSSAATLPVSLKSAREHFKVREEVSSFVLPLGATMNMDGTALFEGIAAIFLAHLYGIDLSGAQIGLVFFTAMISSIGAPGMPSGSMSGMQIVLLSVGIPLEAIGILLVVERPLDTIRTMVNVEGDLIGAIVVDRSAGETLNSESEGAPLPG